MNIPISIKIFKNHISPQLRSLIHWNGKLPRLKLSSIYKHRALFIVLVEHLNVRVERCAVPSFYPSSRPWILLYLDCISVLEMESPSSVHHWKQPEEQFLRSLVISWSFSCVQRQWEVLGDEGGGFCLRREWEASWSIYSISRVVNALFHWAGSHLSV